METESIITVVFNQTGHSESLPVSLTTTTVQELTDLAKSLLGLSDTNNNIQLFKDGQLLDPTSLLGTAGVVHGDLLVAQQQQVGAGGATSGTSSSTNNATGGGLDFSNLLASGPPPPAARSSGGGGGLDFSSLLQQQAFQPNPNAPVYYEGMSFNEAMDHNPNPNHLITLLQTKDHLMKELNYHNPTLANKLRGQPYDRAVQIWREEILKGGIQMAVSKTETYHKESDFRRRLQQNPNDTEVRKKD